VQTKLEQSPMSGHVETTLLKLSRKSDTTAAIRYALGRWEALTRYCDDGRLEIDNNAAERALRAVALDRKNYLFAGSDTEIRQNKSLRRTGTNRQSFTQHDSKYPF
jgi:hypothetical protein